MVLLAEDILCLQLTIILYEIYKDSYVFVHAVTIHAHWGELAWGMPDLMKCKVLGGG